MAGEATRLPAESVIAAELEPGERLLWAGRPKQGIDILWLAASFRFT